jgi:hypothetical protein
MRISKASLVRPGANEVYGIFALALSLFVFAYSARFGQVSILAYYGLWLPLVLVDYRKVLGNYASYLWIFAFTIFACITIFWSAAPSLSLRTVTELLVDHGPEVFQRLRVAARADLDPDRVRAYIRSAIGGRDGSFIARVTIFDPNLGLGNPAAEAEPHVLVTTREASPWPPSPLRVQSATYVRDLPMVKHVGLLGQLYCRRSAQRNGFDDALFTDAEIERNLDLFEEQQRPDGGWDAFWDHWDPTATSDREGMRTIQRLRILRAYDRVAGYLPQPRRD